MKNISHNYLIYILISLTITLTGCFEKDTAVKPHIWYGESYVFISSIYTSQQFYSFENNSVLKSNPLDAWDISFDSHANGWIIRLNSSNGIGAYHTNSHDFLLTNYSINPKNWLFDKSDGDSTSTAIGVWMNKYENPAILSNEVYLIGKYNGSTYIPYKKVVFNMVNDTIYKFQCADIDNSNTQDITIKKDTIYSNNYYNLRKNQNVQIAPLKDAWDILFTPYLTTLYDTHGQQLTYLVRGVLLNHDNVTAAIDSIKPFEQISEFDISNIEFSNISDKIGYKWKTVDINFQSNTGTYTIKKNYTYLIRNKKGSVYKLRFTSFYNTLGLEGYPSFEFLKLL